MAIVKEKESNILTIEFSQEKTDTDYGSCLWARFYFDLNEYTLLIESDCGNYSYSWCITPTESFLKLMSRIHSDYLLEKISSRSIVDGDATAKNIKEYIDDVLDGEEPDFDFSEVENVCYYASVDEVYSELVNVLKNTNANNDNADEYSLLQCIQQKFPYDAEKTVTVFKSFIQPKIKEILESEDK